jgi:haloalkane dehalogenase
MEAFMDHLGLKNDVTLIAHDWGGIIGSGVAGRNPERFSRLILFNTAGFRMPQGKKLPLRLWFARYFPVLPRYLILGMNIFAVMATYMGVGRKMSKEVRKGLLAPYGSWKNRTAIFRFIKDIALEPTDPSYETICETDENLHKLKGKPMMIYWGAQDFIFDTDILEIWKQRFPEAEVYLDKSAGHYVLEDVPDKIIDRMEGFLSSNPLKKKGGSTR